MQHFCSPFSWAELKDQKHFLCTENNLVSQILFTNLRCRFEIIWAGYNKRPLWNVQFCFTGVGGRGPKTSQYLTWPPFALRSPTHLLHMELIRLLIVACGMLIHSSSMVVRSCWILTGSGIRYWILWKIFEKDSYFENRGKVFDLSVQLMNIGSTNRSVAFTFLVYISCVRLVLDQDCMETRPLNPEWCHKCDSYVKEIQFNSNFSLFIIFINYLALFIHEKCNFCAEKYFATFQFTEYAYGQNVKNVSTYFHPLKF